MPNDAPPPEKLLVYSRYPVAGTTKTRLIPAIGAEQAAQLQRWLTERTMATVAALAARRPLAVEVRYTGARAEQMTAWLSDRWPLKDQGEGDLGARLARGFSAAFDTGSRRVAAIGCDCPELSAPLIEQAFMELAGHDLVLGPASDGGYYLIAITGPNPALFRDIAWGGPKVLSSTCRRAAELGLSWGLLPELSDIDRPEDLAAAAISLPSF